MRNLIPLRHFTKVNVEETGESFDGTEKGTKKHRHEQRSACEAKAGKMRMFWSIVTDGVKVGKVENF